MHCFLIDLTLIDLFYLFVVVVFLKSFATNLVCSPSNALLPLIVITILLPLEEEVNFLWRGRKINDKAPIWQQRAIDKRIKKIFKRLLAVGKMFGPD